MKSRLGFKSEISDFRFQISDGSDFRLQTVQTSELRVES